MTIPTARARVAFRAANSGLDAANEGPRLEDIQEDRFDEVQDRDAYRYAGQVYHRKHAELMPQGSRSRSQDRSNIGSRGSC